MQCGDHTGNTEDRRSVDRRGRAAIFGLVAPGSIQLEDREKRKKGTLSVTGCDVI